MLDEDHPENAGYMKLKREAEAPCGTNTTPLDGSGCAVSLYSSSSSSLSSHDYQDGGVESVPVCGMCAVLSDNSYPVGTKWTK